MTIPVDFWQLVGLLVTFLGFLFAAGRLLLTQIDRRLEERFTAQAVRLSALEAASRDEAGQWQRVERELMDLKADLPLHYVRREDYIRGQSVIEAKLDGLALRIENVQLRGVSQ